VATEPPTEPPTEPAQPEGGAAGGNRDRLIFLGVLGAAAIIALIVVLVTGGDDNSSSSSTFDPNSITKPKVEVPDGPPPKTLQSDDITVGDGTEAQAGDTLTMQYVGVNYDDGKEFDSSWSAGQPFTFQLGAGNVIPGWDQGIVGMKVGGRRQLIIPPDLGYGAQGSPPTIKPNETLVFVVDLLDVQPPGAATTTPTP
jgi:peptidylprolyl isomerase